MGLHALLEGPGEVRVLWGGLGVVWWRRGWCLAVFVKLHIAVRLTVAADAAVTLRVNEWTGVAERAALELPFTKLDGATAHAQHKALAVVVQSVGACSQRGIDVGEGHSGWYPLLAEGTCVGGVPHLGSLIAGHSWCMVLLEGVDAIIAICWVLLKKQRQDCNINMKKSSLSTQYIRKKQFKDRKRD